MCPGEKDATSDPDSLPVKKILQSRQLFGIVDQLSFHFVQQHLEKHPPMLTALFGDNIQTRVIELLLQLDQINFKAIYLLKAAQLLKVSHSSVERVVRPLIENNYLLETGVGRRRFFRLNLRNPMIQRLKDFYITLTQKPK